jgi:cellulose synthase/poly-beta-1,6-N-acetylglucosamine synthase-like glycosyltransferase
MKPVVTVVTLTDFEVGTPRAWDDLRRTLRGLARQDFKEPAEFILLEDERLKDQIPADLTEILPQLRIELSKNILQYDLKSEASRLGTAEIVILLDADCVPVPDWLRVLVEAMQSHPEVSVVSGKTRYAGRTFLERACGVLGRAYVDQKKADYTTHISNNNAAFRREVLKTHPLPTRAGPFSSKLHAEAIMRDGWKLWFEPRASVTHAFDGWSMETDIRRHTGYAIITVRQMDEELPHAWMVRFGYLSIPLIVLARICESWLRVLRFYQSYEIRRYELPLVLDLAVILHMVEIPGMISAIQGRPITKTAYR